MDVDGDWQRLNASQVSALQRMGPVLEGFTKHRAAYPAALNHGKSAAEHPDGRQRKEAGAEIDKIWAEVKSLLNGRSHGRR